MPDARLAQWRQRIDRALAAALPQTDAGPGKLHEAMHHAVLLGGKRMRPLLVHAAGELCGAESQGGRTRLLYEKGREQLHLIEFLCVPTQLLTILSSLILQI